MTLGVGWVLEWTRLSAAVMARHRDELVELDRQIGDGDHGENMHRGFTAVLASLDGLDRPPERVGDVLTLVGTVLVSTVGGAAGPLYGTAYLRAGQAAAVPALDAAGVVALLEAAADGVVARGQAHVGQKTMVDAWAPAVAAAVAAADCGAAPVEVLAAAAAGAGAGAVATVPLVATRGRASYLGERSAGHMDPGARSTELLLAAAAQAAGSHRPASPRSSADPESAKTTVGLVVVAHSVTLAAGVVELAGQMAPGVTILPAGGADDGGLGTSPDRVAAAVAQVTADGGAAVLLTDLGSAVFTASTVRETLDDGTRARVVLVDAPLVEGAVAAVVAAQAGADLPGVVAAARQAGPWCRGSSRAETGRDSTRPDPEPAAGACEAPRVPVSSAQTGTDSATGAGGAAQRRADVQVTNPLGLHARPAAVLAQTVAGYDAAVTVDGVDATSVLEIMTLGATQGRTLTLVATGPQADEALAAAVALIGSGFSKAVG